MGQGRTAIFDKIVLPLVSRGRLNLSLGRGGDDGRDYADYGGAWCSPPARPKRPLTAFSPTDDEEADAGLPAEETVVAARRKFDDEEDEEDVSSTRPPRPHDRTRRHKNADRVPLDRY